MTGNLTDLGRGLNFGLTPSTRAAGTRLPRAIAMTDRERAPDPARLLLGLPRSSALILRHTDDDALADMAETAVQMARRLGHRVLISGAPAIALAAGADGVHLSESMLRRHPSARRVRLRPDWIVTAAAHSAGALQLAAHASVDAALLSPVFATASHPGEPVLGVLRFAALCRTAPLPVYALGGVNAAGGRRLKDSGCFGIAGIGLFQGF